jgi:hypothetical protein
MDSIERVDSLDEASADDLSTIEKAQARLKWEIVLETKLAEKSDERTMQRERIMSKISTDGNVANYRQVGQPNK